MSLDLAGILAPLTTPFDAAGGLDLGALACNVERYEETGLAGYLAFGSSGEAVHQTGAERRRLLETLRRAAGPDRLVIAGVNQLSAAAAIRETRRAADAGADAALVITPYFYKSLMTQDVLRRFFSDVAEASPVPVLIYNIPQNTGVTVAPATFVELAQHPNIVGVKDSSGNQAALAETVRLAPEGFAVLTGSAGILYPALVTGAVGAILAVACVAPEPCVELYRAVRAGDHVKALDLQRLLSPLGSLLTAELGIPGLKAAVDLAGYTGGAPRAPLPPLGAKDRARVTAAMHATGLFTGLG